MWYEATQAGRQAEKTDRLTAVTDLSKAGRLGVSPSRRETVALILEDALGDDRVEVFLVHQKDIHAHPENQTNRIKIEWLINQ